jgi:uncharacterized protein
VVGKFLLGMLSGGVLVTGGLVVGSAMFPLPTNDAATGNTATDAVAYQTATGQQAAPTSDAAGKAMGPPAVATVAGAGKSSVWVEPDGSVPMPGLAPATLAEPGPTAPPDEIEAPAVTDETTVEPATDAAAPAEVAQPDLPTAPLPLAQLDADAVLSALDNSAPPQPELAPELAPEPEVAPEVADVLPAPEDGAAEGLDSARLPGTEVPEMPGDSPDALPEMADDPADDAGTAEEPEIAAMPEVEGGPTFKPAPGMAASNGQGVIVNRLPRIGDAPAPESEMDESAAEIPDDPRPIARFATDFENVTGKPVMAIVLIDPGTAEIDRAGLAALPFPVSFALDPGDPATPERAEIYLGAGKEVVMLATGLAEGARASDVEVSFQSMAQGLPEAVAVMDLPGALFQNNRPLASLVVPVVGAQGRGLLTWDQGLNAADQVARREDIAAAVVFRDLASAGDDSASIRRILDRAVFKAGQDGRVAVAGTASPATVAALLEWTVEGRAATVALAPLTAVMRID